MQVLNKICNKKIYMEISGLLLKFWKIQLGKLLKIDSLKLVTFFMAAYPSRFALMVVCLLVSGLAEGLSLLTLLPLLELVTGGGTSKLSSVGELARRTIAVFGLEPTLGTLLVFIVVGIILKSIFLLIASKQAGYTIANVKTDFRLSLIRALLTAQWNYFISHPTGYFINAISSETERAASAYEHTTLLIAAIIQMLVYWTVAILISWKVSLVALILAIILLFFSRRLIAMSRSAGSHQTELMKSLVPRLTEVLHGIKPIKAMALENCFQPFLEAEINGLNSAQQRYVLAIALRNNLQEPLLVIMIAVGLYVAITYGGQPFSGLLVMVFLFYRLMGRIFFVQACYQEMTAQESALWSLQKNISCTETAHETHTGKLQPPLLTVDITLKSVRFSYGDKPVLKDISLRIPASHLVAIFGPSGAGKTTIIDMILGFFRPQAGEICVDGISLYDIDLHAWRRMIGYVPQEMLLFHDTVLKNITFGDQRITYERVEYALRAAGAWDFVSSLPQGMNTEIGERGLKLSGGQRQRLSIARALVREPKLLILDEVTTSLDPKTEAAICETLRKLRGEVTIVSISHQPAIMKVADLAYRLSDGYVEEISDIQSVGVNISTNSDNVMQL